MSDNAFWAIIVSVIAGGITVLVLGLAVADVFVTTRYIDAGYTKKSLPGQPHRSGEGGEMKTAVWNWTKIVAIVPVVWLIVVITSPLLAAFAAYDLVFLGWGSDK